MASSQRKRKKKESGEDEVTPKRHNRGCDKKSCQSLHCDLSIYCFCRATDKYILCDL